MSILDKLQRAWRDWKEGRKQQRDERLEGKLETEHHEEHGVNDASNLGPRKWCWWRLRSRSSSTSR